MSILSIPYQVERVFELRGVIIFVGHEDGDVDVGVERRLAEVVGPHGEVEPPAVAAPVLRHQLEVNGATRPDLTTDGIYSEVAPIVPTHDSIADLKPEPVHNVTKTRARNYMRMLRC